MKNSAVTRPTLRQAIAEDEAFVLSLEHAYLRSHASKGQRLMRPGIGDEFPGNCSVIQTNGVDVGCLMVGEEPGVIQIDQFHIIPSARRQGIGRFILEQLVAKANETSAKLRINLFATTASVAFFERAGFEVTLKTPNRFTMEWRGHPNGQATDC